VHLLAEKLAQLITDGTMHPSDPAWYTFTSSKKSDVDGLDLKFKFKGDEDCNYTFLLPDFVRFLFTGSFPSYNVADSFSDILRQNEVERKEITSDEKQNTKEKEGNTRKKDLIFDEAEVAKSNKEEVEEDETEGEEDDEKAEEVDRRHLHDYTTYFQGKMSALFKTTKKSQKIGDLESAVEEGKRQDEVDQILNSSIIVTQVMGEALLLVKNAAAVAKKQNLPMFKSQSSGSYENLIKNTFQKLMEIVKKDKVFEQYVCGYFVEKGIIEKSTEQQSELNSKIRDEQSQKKEKKAKKTKPLSLESVLDNIIDEHYCVHSNILRLME
jgi:hypothetical protein